MIYLTQLIYIREGEYDAFNEFEDIALPLISKYNGRLLLRLRPDGNAVIAGAIETPFEVHLVEFQSEQDFENFKADKERSKFLHLKEQSIRSVMLIKGTEI